MFTVIIDTDKYSGNFEREMCAYITGVLGICEIGEKESDIALEELDQETIYWFNNNTIQMSDDGSNLRPCAIRPTPGWFNDGMGNNWKIGANNEEVRQKKIKTVQKYYESRIKSTEDLIANGELHLENDLQNYKNNIENAKNKPIPKYDAYQSVAIFFADLPPNVIINIIKERALKFTDSRDINISGFRLIHTQTIEHEEVI